MPGIVFRVIIYINTTPDESDYVGLGHSLPRSDLHFEGHIPVLIPLSTTLYLKTKRVKLKGFAE